MQVPLTIADFLDRAEAVFTHREAIVDEPDPPGGGLGRITYGQLASMARGLAGRLDDLGLGAGERVAIVSPNAARFLVSLFGVSAFGRVLVPVNYRLNAEEIAYIVAHSGATTLLVDPELEDPLRGIDVAHRVVLGTATDAELFGGTATPRFGVTDENATASINYTSGTTARPKGVQLTHRNLWLNATTFGWHTTVTDRDVYLHTLPTFHCNGWGLPYAVTAMGGRHVVIRRIDGEEILRRVDAEGVTFLAGAPAVVAMVLDAATARRERGEAVPGRDRVRIVVAGAPPPSKVIERVEAELGWEFVQIYGLTETSPLLTVNRAGLEYDGLDDATRAQRLARARRPRGRRAGEDRRRGRGARSRQPRLRGLLGAARGVGGGPRGWLVPQRRRRRPRRRRVPGDLGPQEGRDHLGRRERLVDRGGGLPLPAPGSGGGGGDRRPRRPLGRDDQGARRAARAGRVGRADRRRAHRVLPRPPRALQVPDLGRDPGVARPHRDRQAPEVQAPLALLGGSGEARQLMRRVVVGLVVLAVGVAGASCSGGEASSTARRSADRWAGAVCTDLRRWVEAARQGPGPAAEAALVLRARVAATRPPDTDDGLAAQGEAERLTTAIEQRARDADRATLARTVEEARAAVDGIRGLTPGGAVESALDGVAPCRALRR